MLRFILLKKILKMSRLFCEKYGVPTNKVTRVSTFGKRKHNFKVGF